MKLRFTILTLFAVGLMVAPSVSRALTNDALLQQIANLLAQVQFLQAQLQAVEGTTTPGPVVGFSGTPQTTVASAGSCLSLSSNLKRGSRGAEVQKLQQFLTQTRHYTYGEVTSYYGSATEDAVKRWQAQNAVVNSGTPSTTGFGVVGPATRKALRSGCLGAENNEAVARDLVITPEAGQLPLQVTATFSLSGSSCSSFSLDWGDGTKPLSFDAGNTTLCTKDIAHKRATHTYNIPGTHQVTFKAGQGPLAKARVVSQKHISVGDTAPRGFSLSPNSGSVPLTTSITFPVVGSNCTSYEADWGDGAVDRHEPLYFDPCIEDSGTQSLSHTYTAPGTYTVRFKTGNLPISQLEINEQLNVIVRNDITAGSVVEVKPTAGIAPLIVKVDMFGFGEACTSYYLDWGDSTSVQEYEATGESCDGEPFQKSFTHTYIAPGEYNVKTKVGSGTSLANLPLSTQTVVAGEVTYGTVRANCPYPNTPVCGEVVYSCPVGYTCTQVYETYANQCAMEDNGAEFVHAGACNL